MLRDTLRNWKQDLTLRRKLWRGTPVLVYQMGKVGSTSVYESLRSAGVQPLFHVHRMYPQSLNHALRSNAAKGQVVDRSEWKLLYERVIAKRRPARFITLVREPVSRNISAFFQNSRWVDASTSDDPETVRALLTQFVKEYPHRIPLTWFDAEFNPSLGFNVYDHPFPKERGFAIVQDGVRDVLLLKMELDDAVKEQAISDFLGLQDFKITRTKVRAATESAALYKAFKAQFVLPEEIAELMYTAQYTRHFYTPAEIAAMRTRCSPSEK